MKKLLFILLMAVSATAFSQNILYKIDKITIYDVEDSEVSGERILYTKPTILIDVPNNLMTITYPNMEQVRVVLMDEISTEKERDKDGDSYNVIRFNAVDKYGGRCMLSFYVYEEFTNVSVYITYKDIIYAFTGHHLSTTE